MTMSGTLTTSTLASTGAMAINANSGSSALNIQSSAFARSTNGSSFVTETYVDGTTLTDNSGPTAVAAFSFATSGIAGLEITYVIETGTSTADTRIGVLKIVCNASGTQVTSITDAFNESADCGVTWTASVTSGTVSVLYTTTNQGASRTMRADVKSFRR